MPPPDAENLPCLSVALIPVFVLVVSLFPAIRYLDASAHVPIILACALAALIGLKLDHTWKQL